MNQRILTIETADLVAAKSTHRRKRHRRQRQASWTFLLWIVPCTAIIGWLMTLSPTSSTTTTTTRDQHGVYHHRLLRGQRSHSPNILFSHHHHIKAPMISSAMELRRNLRAGRLLIPVFVKPSSTLESLSPMLAGNDETRGLESILPEGYDYGNPYQGDENEEGTNTRMTTVAIVSSILVSIAGTIIFCALLVYMKELYERCFPNSHKAWIERRRRRRQRRRRHRMDKDQSHYIPDLEQTPIPTGGSEEEQVVILHDIAEGEAIFTIHRDEDAPLSCVSSVTNSLAGYETEGEDQEEFVLSRVAGALEQIVEDEHGGPSMLPGSDNDDDLDDLCMKMQVDDDLTSYGEYDSVFYKEKEWTGSFETETSPTLERNTNSESDESTCSVSYISDEDCLNLVQDCDQCQTDDVGIDSSEDRENRLAHQRQDGSRDDDEAERDVAVQRREQELNGAGLQDQSEHSKDECLAGRSSFETQDYIRDIYFIPDTTSDSESEKITSDQILGLSLSDATNSESYPRVTAVSKDSPLTSRVFEGDYIVAINDKDTGGMSATTVLGMVVSCREHVGNATISKMIKLTVMSSQVDDDDDSSSMFDDLVCCSAESTLDVHQQGGFNKVATYASGQTTSMEV